MSTDDKKRINDPDNYRKMSEPFNSPDEANEAMNAFFMELRELRNKHRISEVLTVCAFTVKYEEGEGMCMGKSFNGDPLRSETLAAWLLGQEQAEHREAINKLLKVRKP